VGAAALAEALQIPAEQAALALGTLAAVLPAADDPADGPDEADLRDVLLFLYIQSYKRLVPRAHKDSPSVADVWPSTSAFDGYLRALPDPGQVPISPRLALLRGISLVVMIDECVFDWGAP
jgi:TBCC domain-containing protein 1